MSEINLDEELKRITKSLFPDPLTKRELFAAMAMQAILSTVTMGRNDFVAANVECAVTYADALIVELEKWSKKDGS